MTGVKSNPWHTKEFFVRAILFKDGNNARLEDSQGGDVVRENTKAATERRNIHLFYLGSTVVHLTKSESLVKHDTLIWNLKTNIFNKA